MQDRQFDDMTRLLATTGTRRAVVTGVFGGVLAAIGIGGGAAAKPKSKPGPKPTPRGKVALCHWDEATSAYSTIEVPEHAARAHLRHGDIFIEDLDTQSSAQHCGGCGNTCPDGAACEDGVCSGRAAIVEEPEVLIIHGNLVESGQTIAGSPCSPTIVGAPYDMHTIEHPGGPMSVELKGALSGGGTLFDPVLLLFAGGYLPDGGICGKQIAYDDDGGCGTDSYIEAEFAAGTYTAVVTGYTGQAYGSYTLVLNTFSGKVCPG